MSTAGLHHRRNSARIFDQVPPCQLDQPIRMLTSALRSFLMNGLNELRRACCAGGVVPVYKDGSFFESWRDVSFNTQVDYNRSRERFPPFAPGI